MRLNRISAGATVLALALSAGACGSKDAAGPNIALSLEEVGALARELGGVFVTVAVTPRPAPMQARAPLVAALMRAMRSATPFNQTVACYGGGNASGTGGFDTTAAPMNASVTLTYAACKTWHYTTSGSLQIMVTYAASSDSLHATASGTLNVSTLDGRSGRCPVEVTLSAAGASLPKPTYVARGTACGQRLPGT